MNTIDRPEFEQSLKMLCAGMNQPYTPERVDAYWLGLKDMGIVMFTRVVEHCLGPEYDGTAGRVPTTGQLWKVYRAMKARMPSGVNINPETASPISDPDRIAQQWREQAGTRLLAHIAKQTALRPRRYGHVKPITHGHHVGTPAECAVFAARIAPLLRAKDLWVMDMIELPEHERTPAYMRQTWHDLMDGAERDVDAMELQL